VVREKIGETDVGNANIWEEREDKNPKVRELGNWVVNLVLQGVGGNWDEIYQEGSIFTKQMT